MTFNADTGTVARPGGVFAVFLAFGVAGNLWAAVVHRGGAKSAAFGLVTGAIILILLFSPKAQDYFHANDDT